MDSQRRWEQLTEAVDQRACETDCGDCSETDIVDPLTGIHKKEKGQTTNYANCICQNPAALKPSQMKNFGQDQGNAVIS